MNSKKNLVFLSIIISLLFVPLIPNQNIGVEYVITETETDIDKNTTNSTPPKLLPPPPSNESYVANYFDSVGIEFATGIYFEIGTIFPFLEIPSNRIWDLTAVQLVLTSIDLFFITGDPDLITKAIIASSSMKLDVNGTYIRGENRITHYEFNADENFLLVIMYNRLAQALEVDGDVFTAAVIRSYANKLFTNLTTLFYDTPSNSIFSTLELTQSQYEVIVGPPYHSSARATGLFSMANYASNMTSTYYNQAKLVVDTYRTNANQTFTLPSGDFGFLYRSSDAIASAEYDEADLQGNIYMNTALMQISKYEHTQGNLGVSDNYFNWTDMGETTLKEYFRSSITNLLHTKFNLLSLSLAETALTYENSLYLSHSIEFKRLKLEMTGLTPSFIEINNLFQSILDSTFIAPEYFQAGITESGAQLDLIYDIPHSNPHIVNYQAITMMMKFYPLFTMLVRPTILIPNQAMVCDWFIDIPETTSIFRSSNKSFTFNFEFDITSNTIASIFYPQNYRMNTTSLDGIQLQTSQKVKVNFTSTEGGDHFLLLQIKFANFLVFDYNLLLTFVKIIHISTEPTNPEITQLVDSGLVLTITCEDETGSGIASAEVIVRLAGFTISEFTDAGGYATVFIPIQELMLFYDLADESATSFNTTFFIEASKPGYLLRTIEKDVTIKLNELVLDLNPAPEGKEGDDLTIYLDVDTRIEAPLFNVPATLTIDNVTFQNSTGNTKFELPSTIIIDKDYLKAGETVLVEVTVDIPGMSLHVLSFEIYTVPLKSLERLYYWLEIAFQSDVVKILGSLGIVWVILWKQFSLRILRKLRRCPYCGDITKTKYPYCKNCGLKDMTRKYKNVVESNQKEPRIIRNELAITETPRTISKPVYSQQEKQFEEKPTTSYDDVQDQSDSRNEDDYQY